MIKTLRFRESESSRREAPPAQRNDDALNLERKKNWNGGSNDVVARLCGIYIKKKSRFLRLWRNAGELLEEKFREREKGGGQWWECVGKRTVEYL